jgi:hypothetical protein
MIERELAARSLYQRATRTHLQPLPFGVLHEFSRTIRRKTE